MSLLRVAAGGSFETRGKRQCGIFHWRAVLVHTLVTLARGRTRIKYGGGSICYCDDDDGTVALVTLGRG